MVCSQIKSNCPLFGAEPSVVVTQMKLRLVDGATGFNEPLENSTRVGRNDSSRVNDSLFERLSCSVQTKRVTAALCTKTEKLYHMIVDVTALYIKLESSTLYSRQLVNVPILSLCAALNSVIVTGQYRLAQTQKGGII